MDITLNPVDAAECGHDAADPVTEADVARAVSGMRDALVDHGVFARIQDIDALRAFMETHVYAVWDFMSLVKRLQLDFTCMTLPWTPPRYRHASRLINEIVTGEESDVGLDGHPISHFDMYLDAMEQIGARTDEIRRFVASVHSARDWSAAVVDMEAPDHVRRFVTHTLTVATTGTTAEVIGAFFYGREDVIPDMFTRLLRDWSIDPSRVPALKYYLDRHIQLDADEHGPAAKLIVNDMLAEDPGLSDPMISGASAAISSRLDLWDGTERWLTALRA